MPILDPATTAPAQLVVMGVQGTGKSTIGLLLAKEAGLAFIDGDDLHPPANRAKMAAGQPLVDADREPWLRDVGQALQDADPPGLVIACSALKFAYRDLIRSHAPATVFVHLDGDPGLIAARIAARSHEFMPAGMLASQLATLEPLRPHEQGVVIPVEGSPRQIISDVLADLRAR